MTPFTPLLRDFTAFLAPRGEQPVPPVSPPPQACAHGKRRWAAPAMSVAATKNQLPDLARMRCYPREDRDRVVRRGGRARLRRAVGSTRGLVAPVARGR